MSSSMENPANDDEVLSLISNVSRAEEAVYAYIQADDEICDQRLRELDTWLSDSFNRLTQTDLCEPEQLVHRIEYILGCICENANDSGFTKRMTDLVRRDVRNLEQCIGMANMQEPVQENTAVAGASLIDFPKF